MLVYNHLPVVPERSRSEVGGRCALRLTRTNRISRRVPRAWISLFAFVEAGFRLRLTNLVSRANIGLALVAALVIIYEFFWQR